MADNASRYLLMQGDHSKPLGKRTTYKLSALIFFLLLLLIGCIAASIVVLLTSNENSVQSWQVRPAVLLSILTGFYVMLLGSLFTTGVAVVWWRSINHGTTVQRLHFVHAGANPKDFFPAFAAGGHARRVALAALVVLSVKLAIGPMLQRSSRPEVHQVSSGIILNVDIAREIPDEWFGAGDTFRDSSFGILQGTFLQSKIATRDMDDYSCPTNGTCDGMVEAAGLNYNCKSIPRTINLLDPGSENATLFSIDLALDNSTGYPILYLDTQYVSDLSEDCIATVTTESCSMIPAIVLYSISVKNGVISPNLTWSLDNRAVVSNTTSTADADLKNPTGPLQGIQKAFLPVFESRAILRKLQDGKATDYSLDRSKRAAFWADIFHFTYSSRSYSDTTARNCPLLWDSPARTVMDRIFDYMFRSALEVARADDSNTQKVAATYKTEHYWYITNFRWLAASIAVMTLGVAAALSLLWGWWQLQHCPTLSPLETGRAFGAPIFAAAAPKMEASSIVKEVGHERVAFDGHELVWSGSIYTTGVGGSLGTKSSKGSREPGIGEMEGDFSAHSSLRGRGHRRGMSSVSDVSPSPTQRPSFEHSLGYTTRQPYDDEEEVDIGEYGRPRSRSHGNDTSSMIPMSLGFTHNGSPKLPLIPRTGSIRMEPVSPCSRMRRGSRCAADAAGMGRRPLSKIEERRAGSPEEGGRFA
jgi:hypothetical protein